MPGGKTTCKHPGNTARQLLFSEVLEHLQPPPSTTGSHPPTQPHTMVDPVQEETMERILRESSVVGRRLEGMDNAITLESKSMRLDIVDFQSRVTGLEQRLSTMEGHLITTQDRDQELLCLHSKLIDLEDRSHKDNVCFFGFQESIKGTDTQSFLRMVLPKLTDLIIDPPLEFQRVHRLVPK
ncbi:hypothetical protein NDU88_004190 [Pleurodeles waltl]|uniref:Uncharacterized protein n=1 Tax=Pleurodeles waltl TaxID=8319 RepID=A0AAV7WR95_PLEWA|nr:hypothetical protein NDU88_004190 [Pleurodeles waltl]